MNMFFRSKHAAGRYTTMEEKVAFSLHVAISSINKCWREQQASHVVICLDGRSWRKTFYAPYKKNREVARAALTEEEQEEDKLFFAAYAELVDFFVQKTNCTVLTHPELEADDLIAGWIQSHSEDNHTIISSDSDYYQLITETVNQYNGIADELITLTGIYNGKGKQVIDKKTKEPKTIGDPKFILFEKCMRGDSSDNVFSAYPRVGIKSTKNKVGLLEAFSDRDKKGWAWNNMMLQTWLDHDKKEHKVIDDYNRNVTLIDLTAQPEDIRVKINETISNTEPKTNLMAGVQFLKFCGKHDLVKLSEPAQLNAIATWLQATYKK